MTSQTTPVPTAQSPQSGTPTSYPRMTKESLQAAIEKFKQDNKGKTLEDLAKEREAQGIY